MAGETNKNHVSLSTKSLNKVLAWCEENEETPLADAYMAACYAVGSLDSFGMYRQIESALPKSRKSYISDVLDIVTEAYVYRDRLGRIIINMINRSGEK